MRHGRASAGTVGTNGQLTYRSARPFSFAQSTHIRCASDPGTTTWKKEALFFFPSSTAIYLSKDEAIQLSGRIEQWPTSRP